MILPPPQTCKNETSSFVKGGIMYILLPVTSNLDEKSPYIICFYVEILKEWEIPLFFAQDATLEMYAREEFG